MTEKRTPWGIYYIHHEIHPVERAYPLTYHFLADNKIKRIRTTWPKRWSVNDRDGWLVGEDILETTRFTSRSALIIEDGKLYVDALDWVRIRK